MKVVVVNKYKPINDGRTKVYIGRGSPLGNPYPITSEHSRDCVCDMHEELMRTEWEDHSMGRPSKAVDTIKALAVRAHRGERIALECFCKPKRCHGDFIAKIINWYVTTL